MQHSRTKLSGMIRFGQAGLLVLLVVGCAETESEHPALYNYSVTPNITANVDPCLQPNTGCRCENPGEVFDCGRVTIKVDGYENCYDASRICMEDRVLGPCVPDQTIVAMGKNPA
jgi:hypothetical protein